jgi:hypothetical protein
VGVATIGGKDVREQWSPEQEGELSEESGRSTGAPVHPRGIDGRASCDPHPALAEAWGIIKAATTNRMAGARRLDERLPEVRVFIPDRSLIGWEG